MIRGVKIQEKHMVVKISTYSEKTPLFHSKGFVLLCKLRQFYFYSKISKRKKNKTAFKIVTKLYCSNWTGMQECAESYLQQINYHLFAAYTNKNKSHLYFGRFESSSHGKQLLQFESTEGQLWKSNSTSVFFCKLFKYRVVKKYSDF